MYFVHSCLRFRGSSSSLIAKFWTRSKSKDFLISLAIYSYRKTGFCLWASSFRKIHCLTYIPLTKPTTHSVSSFSNYIPLSVVHHFSRAVYALVRCHLVNTLCPSRWHQRFSNPRSQEEEDKTENVWMKGHAGKYCSLRCLVRNSHNTYCRSHELHGNLESTCNCIANQRLGWTMAVC